MGSRIIPCVPTPAAALFLRHSGVGFFLLLLFFSVFGVSGVTLLPLPPLRSSFATALCLIALLHRDRHRLVGSNKRFALEKGTGAALDAHLAPHALEFRHTLDGRAYRRDDGCKKGGGVRSRNTFSKLDNKQGIKSNGSNNHSQSVQV
jgi:hypothetical protein